MAGMGTQDYYDKGMKYGSGKGKSKGMKTGYAEGGKSQKSAGTGVGMSPVKTASGYGAKMKKGGGGPGKGYTQGYDY